MAIADNDLGFKVDNSTTIGRETESQGFLADVQESLDRAINRTTNNANRLQAISGRVFGAEPVSGTQVGEDPPYNSTVDAISGRIQLLGEQLDWLEGQVSRLEQL